MGFVINVLIAIAVYVGAIHLLPYVGLNHTMTIIVSFILALVAYLQNFASELGR